METSLTKISFSADSLADQLGNYVASLIRGENIHQDIKLAEQLLNILSEVKEVSNRLKRLSPNKVEANGNLSAKSEYPKFKIDGKQLIKIGLKRGSFHEEYNHSCSFDELKEIIEELKSYTSPLDVKKFISKIDAKRIPAYKAYLVLNALGKIGDIQNEKKGYYQAKTGENFNVLSFENTVKKLESFF